MSRGFVTKAARAGDRGFLLEGNVTVSIDLIKRVLSTLSRHAMLRAGDRVGVGVSGGSDSVALLRILREVGPQQGIRLAVLHFNHGLRGADSEGDEEFVAALAAHFELPFFSAREDVAGVARARHWNLEDAARRLRYTFFAARVAEGRIDRVAVAHTADDQAERVLARVRRATRALLSHPFRRPIEPNFECRSAPRHRPARGGAIGGHAAPGSRDHPGTARPLPAMDCGSRRTCGPSGRGRLERLPARIARRDRGAEL